MRAYAAGIAAAGLLLLLRPAALPGPAPPPRPEPPPVRSEPGFPGPVRPAAEAADDDPEEPGASAVPLAPPPAAPGAERPAYPPSRPDLLPPPPGEPIERLTYRARVWKGLFGKEVGEATFEVFRDPAGPWGGPPGYRLVGRAKGSAFGYSVDAAAESAVGPDLSPRRYRYAQTGFKTRNEGLDFLGDRAFVFGFKHCRLMPLCADPRHQVAGPGGKAAHCPGKRCKDPAHRVWTMRKVHPLDGDAADVQTALYRARALALDPTAPPLAFRLFVSRTAWDVRVEALEQAEIAVPAGRFTCRRLRVSASRPDRAPDEADPFEGPFGITGDIMIWADERTRIPVRVSGTIPFGWNLNAQVDLVRREGEFEAPRAAPAAKPSP